MSTFAVRLYSRALSEGFPAVGAPMRDERMTSDKGHADWPDRAAGHEVRSILRQVQAPG